MIELIRGAVETVVLNVSDELQNLTDLTNAEPINWQIYREFDREVVLLTGAATVDPDNAMQALCLVDTSTLPSGRLELYAELTAAPDQPILGPFIMKIEGGTQAGVPDSVYYQPKSEKAQPNGYASLDSDGRVPVEQVPGGSSSDGAVSTFRGVEIYSNANFEFTYETLIQDVPFHGVRFDSEAMADTVNHKLVIPAGLDGIWHYGFVFQFVPDSVVEMYAYLGVNGTAWSLVAAGKTRDQTYFTLASNAIDRFLEGHEISVQLVVEAPVNLATSASSPQRLFAYYLGPVA
jgi:hypothetical protein